MSRWIRNTLQTAYILVIGAALTFGVTQTVAAMGSDECGDHFSEIGTCPPYDNGSCHEDCNEIFGFSGMCALEGPGECCICQY